MNHFSLANPVFATYAIAAAILLLKGVAMSWLTVVRMISEKAGMLNPEDLRKTPFNMNPDPSQLETSIYPVFAPRSETRAA